MNMSQYIQIIGVVIVFAIYIYGLFKVIKITRGSSSNKWNKVIGFTAATLLLIYLILNTYIIGPADFVQIMLTFGLVVATTLYAISATKQADASVKMAEEMREQRYETVRPVVDIQMQALDESRRRGEQMATLSELVSSGISCMLRNVGLGPAIDVYSFVPSSSGGRQVYNFGTLPIEREAQPLSIDSFPTSFPTILSPKQEGDRVVIEIYYKDVYGREFESSREIVGKQGDWKLGSLKVESIREGSKPR